MEWLRRCTRSLILLSFALGMLCLQANPASADATVRAVPSAADAGTRIRLMGNGLADCVAGRVGDLKTGVRVLWDGKYLLDYRENGDQGHFSVNITVPAGAGDGDHVIAVGCQVQDPDSRSFAIIAQTTLHVPAPKPTLQLSVAKASPGDQVVVTGDHFNACFEPDSGDTSVRIVWDEHRLADSIQRGGRGHFSVTIGVPRSAQAGDHTVAAGCSISDPDAPRFTTLATVPLRVLVANSGGSTDGGGSSNDGGSTRTGGNADTGSGGTVENAGSSAAPVAALLGVLVLLGLLTASYRRKVRAARSPSVLAVACWTTSPVVTVRDGPGAASMSIRLEPRGDPGRQTIQGPFA
jgi:hypothetical protein